MFKIRNWLLFYGKVCITECQIKNPLTTSLFGKATASQEWEGSAFGQNLSKISYLSTKEKKERHVWNGLANKQLNVIAFHSI